MINPAFLRKNPIKVPIIPKVTRYSGKIDFSCCLGMKYIKSMIAGDHAKLTSIGEP